MKRRLAGMLLMALFFGVTPQARPDSMYWVDGTSGHVWRANLDGTGQQVLVSGLSFPTGIDLDLAGNAMYWVDFSDRTIRRANLDGSGQTTLLSDPGNPVFIALDVAGGKMYWTNPTAQAIKRANLDGSGQETVISNLPAPHGIALDVGNGQIYWADADGGDIRRANLDGSGQEILVKGLANPHGIALDLSGGKVYWVEPGLGDIKRANLDGSSQETLVQGQNFPVGMTLDVAGGQMYWGNAGSGEIRWANLDGTGQQLVVSGDPGAGDLKLVLSAPGPQPIQATGYSADVISDKDPQARFAQPFSGGTYAWFEAGAVDDEGTQHPDGLPAGLTFASATDSGAVYQIQPANANNVLQLGAGQTGTLTLTTPTAYNTLYVLASSGDGTPTSMGSGNINFADGGTQPFSFNSFDWCNGPYGEGGMHPEAVLPGPMGRADVGPNGTAFTYNQDCEFQIYETVVAIDPSHVGVAIASIDFTSAPDAFLSNILAVSGQ